MSTASPALQIFRWASKGSLPGGTPPIARTARSVPSRFPTPQRPAPGSAWRNLRVSPSRDRNPAASLGNRFDRPEGHCDASPCAFERSPPTTVFEGSGVLVALSGAGRASRDAHVCIPDVGNDDGGSTEPDRDDGGVKVLTPPFTTGGAHGGRGGQPHLKPPGCEETHNHFKSLKRKPRAPLVTRNPLWKIRDFPQGAPSLPSPQSVPLQKKERQKLTDKRVLYAPSGSGGILAADWIGMFHALTGAGVFLSRRPQSHQLPTLTFSMY